MTDSNAELITLFTTSWCAHALSVGSFLEKHNIPVEQINIDDDPGARQKLIELNNGYASVPTLLFPDGTKLTEPTLFELRSKLRMSQPDGLIKKLRTLVAGSDDSSE